MRVRLYGSIVGRRYASFLEGSEEAARVGPKNSSRRCTAPDPETAISVAPAVSLGSVELRGETLDDKF